MKIAFFGTPAFTVEFLDYLKAHDLTPRLIVTGMDVPIGRKQIITAPEPKLWAQQENIPCVQPDKNLTELTDTLAQEDWDLFIVIAYGKILPERLINLPKHGTINVHYSLLPKYRGASPVEHAILSGDTTTGVCIQHMVYALDAGAIIKQQEVEIQDTDTHIILRDKLNQIAKPLLLESIKTLASGNRDFIIQDETQKSITKKIKKTDGLITLNEDSETLWRKYRAYFGWPGLYFMDEKNGQSIRVKIGTAHFNKGFIIDTVIPEGKNEMQYEDYKKWK